MSFAYVLVKLMKNTINFLLLNHNVCFKLYFQIDLQTEEREGLTRESHAMYLSRPPDALKSLIRLYVGLRTGYDLGCIAF